MNTENQEKKQIMKCQTGQELRCNDTVHQTISARRIDLSLFKQGENGDAMTQGNDTQTKDTNPLILQSVHKKKKQNIPR